MEDTPIQINILEFVPLFTQAPGKLRRKRNLGGFRKQAGVYIIREKDVVVYVGMSVSCVVEALYRHFYEWNDHKNNHVTYVAGAGNDWTATLFVTTKDEAPKIEKGLIYALRPRDNREKYETLEREYEQPPEPDYPVGNGPVDDIDLPF
jgi:hypothetical protein